MVGASVVLTMPSNSSLVGKRQATEPHRLLALTMFLKPIELVLASISAWVGATKVFVTESYFCIAVMLS